MDILALPGMEAQLDPLSEAQLKSLGARRVFEAQESADPWMDDYWRFIGEGWSWRQTVYMIWAALPPSQRRPKTQAELATEVLGLTSDRVIRDWKADNPAMQAEIAKLMKSMLFKHRPAIYDALVQAASNPNPRAHADRKLAMEMLGDYVPRQKLTVGPETPDDLAGASDEELRTLAAGRPGGSDE